jgi:hypothetical protein
LWNEHNQEFMDDPSFARAYNRRALAVEDYNWHWQIHIVLWTAYSTNRLTGDLPG